MLNIDHGELNPHSLIEKERQSQLVARREGKRGLGGGDIVHSERECKHSTIRRRPSRDRKSTPARSYRRRRLLPSRLNSRPRPGPRASLCRAATGLTPRSDTIPPQPGVTSQSSRLITSCTAQSMVQGLHKIAGPVA